MRPNISGSLRRIALGIMLPAALTSTGCYHSTMYPGYGAPMYGNPAPGYGGYQGIQTMTPGTYYAPGTAPTYNPNSLTPQADPNASGSSSGSGVGGQNGGSSNAPPYSPPAGDPPKKPVPDGPYYESGAGGDGSAPQDDPAAEPQLNQNDSGSPSTLSKPAANEEWAIKPASGSDSSDVEAQEPTESVESPATEPALETVEQEAEGDEEPSLLAPPMLEEQEPVKP